MKPGFYTIMAAQFLSSLADNALLIAAIALLREAQSADWLIPFLKLVFVVSYVMLAPFVGAFADSIPKGRVMFLTNMRSIWSRCLRLISARIWLVFVAPKVCSPRTRNMRCGGEQTV